jgi:hypothetical protein
MSQKTGVFLLRVGVQGDSLLISVKVVRQYL